MPTDCQRWEVSLWTGVHPPIPSCQHPKQSKLSLPPTLPLYWLLSGDQLAPTFSYNSPVAPWCPGTHMCIKEHKTYIKYMCVHILTCTDRGRSIDRKSARRSCLCAMVTVGDPSKKFMGFLATFLIYFKLFKINSFLFFT